MSVIQIPILADLAEQLQRIEEKTLAIHGLGRFLAIAIGPSER